MGTCGALGWSQFGSAGLTPWEGRSCLQEGLHGAPRQGAAAQQPSHTDTCSLLLRLCTTGDGRHHALCPTRARQRYNEPAIRAGSASKSCLTQPFLFNVHLSLPFIKVLFSLINHSLSSSFEGKQKRAPNNCTSCFILLLLELWKATKQECPPTCLLLSNHFPWD